MRAQGMLLRASLEPAAEFAETAIADDRAQLRPAHRIQPSDWLFIGQRQDAPGSARREWLPAGRARLIPCGDRSPIEEQPMTDAICPQAAAGDQIVDASNRDTEFCRGVRRRDEIDRPSFLNHSRTRIEQEIRIVNQLERWQRSAEASIIRGRCRFPSWCAERPRNRSTRIASAGCRLMDLTEKRACLARPRTSVNGRAIRVNTHIWGLAPGQLRPTISDAHRSEETRCPLRPPRSPTRSA